MRILIVEDEHDIARFLTMELHHEGYDTACAHTGLDGLELALSQPFDLMLLDVMLPDLSGIELLRRVRKHKQTPAFLLTARDSTVDKVTGLDAGANDYITKPFHIEELLARIRVWTRASDQKPGESDLAVLDLVLNERARVIYRDGQELPLTKREYDMLAHFIRNPDIAMSRDQLISAVWGYDSTGADSNVVDVLIRHIRTKLNQGFPYPHIETVRGVGYMLRSKAT